MEIHNLSIFVLVFASAQVTCQINWGKKVPCFERAGTLLCPGCPSRVGTMCPRKPEDGRPEFPSCEMETTTPFWVPKTFSTPGGPPTTTYSTMTDEFSTPGGPPSTTYNTMTDEYSTEPDAWRPPSLPPVRLYLYSYFRPRHGWRILREVDRDTREICQSNADCPCPLICCKQGKGCPKRCLMGLKLHPHIRGRR